MAGRERADVVVVGAGTIGGWAATFLAEDGAGRVVVARARPGRPGREQPGGRHRPGPGRDAGDGRARSLDDRLLQRPAGPLRDGLRVPRARLPDHRDHRP